MLRTRPARPATIGAAAEVPQKLPRQYPRPPPWLAVVLVHPTCGPTQEDDIPGEVRHKTYEVLIEETKDTASGKRTKWAYLPYSMHMAGPREAIQHMMIRKNFGCTHFIVGRDMAGSKSSVDGEDFYGAYDAQDFAKANADELGVQAVPSLNLVCTMEEGYLTADEAKEKHQGGVEAKTGKRAARRKIRIGESPGGGGEPE